MEKEGKLKVLEQEMARVNIDLLGISELKWIGTGKFNSDDHYIYYCGQGSLRRNGVAILATKSLKCSTWMQSQKRQMISVHFQGKAFNITVIQVSAPPSNAEEAEVGWFYEDLQDLLELTPKKRCPFHYRGLECKSRKSRNSWSNRQIWPWSTGQRLIEFCQENALVIANTLFQQHRRRLCTWTSADGQHQNQIDDILCSQRRRNYIVSRNKTRRWLWLGS